MMGDCPSRCGCLGILSTGERTRTGEERDDSPEFAREHKFQVSLCVLSVEP